MIPLAVPHLAGNEARYLRECVDTNFVSSVGPFVDRLETLVAECSGAAHAVATSSGTAGLHAALLAAGVSPGELVVVPAFTFIATANAVSHCGAVPWLLDITETDWTLDPEQLAGVFERETRRDGGSLVHVASGRRVAAVLPVHTLGAPADMDPILELARAQRVPVVADAAAALGSLYRGRPPGALGADLSVFSFNGNKTVTAGGGGAVVGADAALCDRVRHLTTTGRSGTDYTHDVVAFNSRMTNLQAAVGCAQLEQLDVLVAAKRRIARRYDEALADAPGVRLFPRAPWARSACWMSGVRVGGVPELVARLGERGVGARSFWKPIHLQPPYREAPRAPLPVSEAVWAEVLTLPCSAGLVSEDQETVIEAVRGCLAR
ncbi:MAG: aminotransferase class I/II-fold pyridoxal phosphate-dependent enzyme [Myxococcota bacterium]|nr:pyridoxal-5'-phosphate-dependent protein [Deltaproteobacteria bacterium]MCP4239669.1 aminotransferase class I/II-fold pyridoxal phosphate-dependent enzyme [bacterium]MDP6073722.1 aminotransferase class I/II-fold pyridoxal phosphate-dependent enzyme [Myxococcota bacterium]MDP6244059.1 aminotransferase class I/II-fold pyridoxal phosphate-dependent enzyme [Myxococcota bacterium]MDP7074658.1 aminotransferase class I/II-fold pyridoxal phosphate-dependent enzyme [Myxococcota bacterium]